MTANTTPLVFDAIALIEIPVTIGDVKYTLREADGDAALKYRSATVKGMTVNKDGSMSNIQDSMGAEAILVASCLIKAGTENKVGVDTVKRWPNKVIKALFNRAKEISDLDDTDTIKTVQAEIIKLQTKLKELEEEETEDPNDDGSTSTDG